MSIYTIAMFGEAEKGHYRTAYYLQNLPQLVEYLGNPPCESKGLFYAIQALMYHHNLIFFRVEEEGYSYQDYLSGLRLLNFQTEIATINALCLPGVGNKEIIDAATPFCKEHHSILITTEPDLYDYLTETAKRLSA